MENYKPKTGDYLLYFYHGVIGGINSVMRITNLKRGEMTLINVHFEVGLNISYPMSVGTETIEPKPTKFCFTPITEDDFKSLILDIDINDIISDISKYRSISFNSVKGWTVKSLLEDHYAIKRVTRDLSKHETFRVYRVWKDRKIIYDPIEGYKE